MTRALHILCLSVLAVQVSAQDTVKLTLRQAEDRFLKNNLQLLAGRYNIDIASANVLTAKLFQNPEFSFANGIHDSGGQNPLSEQAASISQLITTAGKRNKNIQLAKIGVQQAQYQFFDLLRTLKYTLHNDFYTVYYQQQSARVYNEEIVSLVKILGAFREEYKKGYIAQKEVLRIQSQLYSLRVEYTNLITTVDTTEKELRLMLRLPARSEVLPQVNQGMALTRVESVPYKQLLDSASVNRFDLRYGRATVDYNAMNLKLQKAMAFPDVTLSYNYDKEGSFSQNAMSAGIAISLPFFNRNQGNIQQARAQVQQSQLQLQSLQEQVENEVTTGYRYAMTMQQLDDSIDPGFRQDYNKLIQEVVKNYLVRNIGLLDFLNYYDDYKNNTLLLNNALLNRVLSLEQMNYVTGTNFYNKP